MCVTTNDNNRKVIFNSFSVVFDGILKIKHFRFFGFRFNPTILWIIEMRYQISVDWLESDFNFLQWCININIYLKTFEKCSLVINGSAPGRLGWTNKWDIVVKLSTLDGSTLAEDEYEEEEVNGEALGVHREVILVLGDVPFSMRPSITDPVGLHDTVFRAGTLKQLL